MKNLSINLMRFVVVLLLAIFLWTCEDSEETFDPINPNLSVDNVIGTIESASRTLLGAERQLSLTLNEFVAVGAIASDNYVNTRTFFNQNFDALTIATTDADVNALQFDIARLRALTTLALDEVGPADPDYTSEQESGYFFLRGMAYLYGGSYFAVLPAEAGGNAVPAADHLANAVADFTSAIQADGTGTYGLAAHIGRLRANYLLGNKTEAVSDANAIISAAPDFLYSANFDGINTSAADNNTMQDALFDRGSFDDLQPLPTLDFLDPKYNGSDPNFDFPTPVVKVEEAHFILAEAALSEGRLEDAKDIMRDIIGLVATRPTATFDDRVEGRTHLAPGSRPDTSFVMVAPGPDRPLESGLVLDRGAEEVTVPTVSGTSYDNADIDAIGDIDFAYESLYRMRQEVFIAEGMRFIDLGLRMPVSQNEADANPNIRDTDQQAVIPPFLASAGDIDAIDYDAAAGTATVLVNVNRLISENRTSAFVAPFE
ncbi:MAG: hypothetical protein AAGF87_15135 [Bacteroidota bacterium]